MRVLGNRTSHTSLRFCGTEIIFGICIRLTSLINIWILLWDRACMTLEPTPPNQLRVKRSV